MSRTPVSLRPAELEDAPALVELWSEALRRADRQDQVADVELIIKAAAESPDERVVVAEYDGNVAGAVYLRVTTLSPLNLDLTVQAISPHVFPSYRRHGVGRTLMEAAVEFAEELGVPHVATAASASSRDGNRFMARLALGPHAVLRVAATQLVRAKLEAQKPPHRGRSGRSRSQVLAARRSLKRSRVQPDAGS